jgi:hypothetical protein
MDPPIIQLSLGNLRKSVSHSQEGSFLQKNPIRPAPTHKNEGRNIKDLIIGSNFPMKQRNIVMGWRMRRL